MAESVADRCVHAVLRLSRLRFEQERGTLDHVESAQHQSARLCTQNTGQTPAYARFR